MEETSDLPELVERVAALDLGKATLTACVRVPHADKPGRRCQEVREYRTTTRALLTLAADLRGHGVTLVAMEAASDYWKPVFYLLEAEGFTCWLLNARHVKNVPGRPRTGKLDAIWLAKVVERGMCSPSLVQPRGIRRLRDLTRYRRALIRQRTAEKQRAEKLLEDAQIKLSAVVSDIFGMSGRAMLEAMTGGERNPRALAQLPVGRMRAKLVVLEEALTGHFDDHHAFICRMMLDRIGDITRQAAGLTARIEEQIAPFAGAAARLDEIPGAGRTGAQELIAETGVDMTRFPDAAHLVSRARFAPIGQELRGQEENGLHRQGQPVARRHDRGDRLRRRPHGHIPGRALPAHRPPQHQVADVLAGSVALADRSGRETGSMTSSGSSSVFAGFRFPRDVIANAVRWYLRYGLSYRDVEELLAERGVTVDHVTIYRWVQRFTPEFIEAARFCRHAPGDRWFADETYVKVAGRWTYLYRAIDQHGQVIDVLLSARRDLAAARRFFTRALRAGTIPAEVTTDRAAAYPRVLDELIPSALHTVERYANNPVEADHGRLKARLRPMRGLKRDRSARILAAGHAFVQNLRRGHYELATDVPTPHRICEAFDQLAMVI